MLLSNGVPVDVRNSELRSALDVAVEAGHGEVMDALLQRGADPDQLMGHWQEQLPVRFAVQNNKIHVLASLLHAGADPDRVTLADPGTALLDAARQGDTRIAALLLEAGARAQGRPDRPGLPLRAAIGDGRPRMVELLLERGAPATAGDLHLAANALRREESGRPHDYDDSVVVIERFLATPRRQ